MYLLYLAFKIARASPPQTNSGASAAGGKPLTFIQAALFQWVNAKAWAMALTAVSVYSPSQNLGAVVIVAAVFGLINLPSVSLWTVLGQQMRRLLTSPKRLAAFDVSMAALLVASLYPVLAG